MMKRETQSDVLLIAVTVIAAISWMFSKEAIALMPPLLFMGLRFLLAAAFLACLGHKALRRLSMAHVLRSARGAGVWCGYAVLGAGVGAQR